ncbi:MAG: hypothetical protein K8R87_02665 [Verrucomicrobia bacterium]|nr:hypothetical protein [Verrucomicrobiota bacterium]
MYFVRTLCVLLAFCFCRQSLFSQDTVEQWQKLTVEDFPQIAVKGSELNLKYVQRVKTLRDTDPSFFRDPRWPYAVAEQITAKSLIPGIEDVVIPPSRTSSSSMRSSSTGGVYTPSGTKVDVIAAKDVATKGVVGQMICVQGVIAKTMLPGLAVQDRFYLQLKPDLLCEFMVASFFTRSGRSMSDQGYDHMNYSQLKLRFLSGSIFVYGPRSRSYEDRNSVVKLGEILKAGEMVYIYGRLEGSGSVGIDKGLMIRDCLLLKPN